MPASAVDRWRKLQEQLPGSARLLAVSKGHPAEAVRELGAGPEDAGAWARRGGDAHNDAEASHGEPSRIGTPEMGDWIGKLPPGGAIHRIVPEFLSDG